MAWIAVGGAAVSLAGKAFGAYKGAKANKASQAMLTAEREKSDAEFNNNASKDFLTTNVAQGAVKELQNNLEDNRKAVAGRAAITGGSDEAVVAGNAAVNNNFQQGLSRIAGNATQYQTQQDALHRQSRAILNQQQIGLNNSKAESAANLVDNAGQLVSGLGNVAGLQGGTPRNVHLGDPGTVGNTGNFASLVPKSGGLVAPVAGLKLK